MIHIERIRDSNAWYQDQAYYVRLLINVVQKIQAIRTSNERYRYKCMRSVSSSTIVDAFNAIFLWYMFAGYILHSFHEFVSSVCGEGFMMATCECLCGIKVCSSHPDDTRARCTMQSADQRQHIGNITIYGILNPLSTYHIYAML